MDPSPTTDDEVVELTEDEVEALVDEAVDAVSSMTAEELVDLTEQLIAERDQVTAERDELRDTAQRLAADFDNFRKRSAREREDESRRAVGRFVESLLPVLDACEQAQAHGSDGVEPIAKALLGALEQQGLTQVGTPGEPFDPTWHEAVMHEPGDGGEQVVAEVFRTGYRWEGSVLRAAMVKVAG